MVAQEYQVEQVVAGLAKDGWLEADRDVILDVLDRQIYNAVPRGQSLNGFDKWEGKAEKLVEDVRVTIKDRLPTIDPTIAEAAIQLLTAIIIEQAIGALTNACAGIPVNPVVLTIIASYVALVIVKEMQDKSRPAS